MAISPVILLLWLIGCRAGSVLAERTHIHTRRKSLFCIHTVIHSCIDPHLLWFWVNAPLSQNTHTHTHRRDAHRLSFSALSDTQKSCFSLCACDRFLHVTSYTVSFLSGKALKESFIKAIGTGLGFNLQRVEFHLSSGPLTQGRALCQTKMHLDEEEEEDWVFEVSLFEEKCENGQKITPRIPKS